MICNISIVLIISFLSFCLSFTLDGSSITYTKFSPWLPCQNGSIIFQFKTQQTSALLLYTDGGKASTDYFELKLVNGVLNLVFSVNNVRKWHTAGQMLNNNEWHSVGLILDGRITTLKLDEISYFIEDVHYDPSYKLFANSENFVFIGGLSIDYNQRLNDLACPLVVFEPRFSGSVQNIFYNNCSNTMMSPKMLQSEGLTLDGNDCMKKNDCMNSGICVTVEDEIMCDCSMTEYTGEFCEIEKQLLEATFQGKEYIMYDLRQHGDAILSSNDVLKLSFKTTYMNGLLLYTGEHKDYMVISLRNGALNFAMALGLGTYKKIVDNDYRLDNGQWHQIVIIRNSRQITIWIDGQEKVKGSTVGDYAQLSSNVLYIAGWPNHKDTPGLEMQLNFKGCLKKVEYQTDSIKLDLIELARKDHNLYSIHGNVTFGQCKKVIGSQPVTFTTSVTFVTLPRRDVQKEMATLTFDEAHYVLVKLPRESMTEAEDISLRFRTVRSSGLLLMTSSADSKDTMELYLERGTCKLIISLAGSSKALTIGHNLNDDQWHTVYIKRRGHIIEMQSDSKITVTDTIDQTMIQMPVLKLVLGSVGPLLSGINGSLRSNTGFRRSGREQRMQKEVHINPHPGFVGSMQQFVYNGNHYFDMAREQNAKNIEVTARFDNGESILHNEVTFESRNSYVRLPHQLLKSNNIHFALSFKFKTLHQSGLMLFSGLASHDFLALELHKGFLYYIYNMGGGSKRILVYTPDRLNDNKWHDVSLFCPQLDQQQIRVDNYAPTVEDMKAHTARQFDLKGPLFVGGVIKTRYNLLPMKILSHVGYIGCMASLEINGKRINIIEAAMEFNDTDANFVVKGCSSAQNLCHMHSCYHGGRCEQQWNSYVCNCDMTSYTGPLCTEASVSYRFGSNNGLIVFEYPKDTRPSTKNDYLVLGITTTVQNTAKLVRIDSADSDDFIEIELVYGNIFMVYNMGQMDIPIVTLQQKVNDGKYHVIKFKRSEANASLQVDNEITRKIPVGTKMNVFNNQAQVWLGGHKDSQGSITHAFHGTISGFFFNGLRLLDNLRDGDKRVRAEGDVTLVEPSQEVMPPEKVILPVGVNVMEMQYTQGLKISNPTKDDIIFSGEDPECYNEDDECASEASEDDIITPTIIITRLSTPEPLEQINHLVFCNDCDPIGTELALNPNTSSNYTNIYNLNSSGKTTPNLGASEVKSTTNSGHLNIFLIIGITAGVLVVLIILVIALYKFHSQGEGIYGVDETQNCANLEAKKQPTSSSTVMANRNGSKTSSKKKDVKEWYV